MLSLTFNRPSEILWPVMDSGRQLETDYNGGPFKFTGEKDRVIVSLADLQEK